MAYKKVYYDDIWNVTSKGAIKASSWLSQVSDLQNTIQGFLDFHSFKGEGAESMVAYLEEVHTISLGILMTLLSTYDTQAKSYYVGYQTNVDPGHASKKGGHEKTNIIFDEVNNNGSIKKKVKKAQDMAKQVASDANSVKYSISHITHISASPKYNDLVSDLKTALNKATKINDKVIAFEGKRKGDFDEIDKLIMHVENIINFQLGKARVPVTSYVSGGIGTMVNMEEVAKDIKAANKIVKKFAKSNDYKIAGELAYNREQILQEQRQWIKWVAIGIAAIGAIVLTAVTLGGASVLVCASVGAIAGIAGAAANKFADNYIKHGDFIDGMDWGEFGKDCLVAGVAGAVAGGLGALAHGSAIQQPIKAALKNAGINMIKTGSGELAGTAWDLGEAVVSGKPGGDIMSVLQKDANEMFKNTAVAGVEGLAGGYVASKLGVSNASKGYIRKLGEKALANFAESYAGAATKTAWECGEAYLDPHSSKNYASIAADNFKQATSKFATKTVSDAVAGVAGGKIDKINNTGFRTVVSAANDTVADTAGDIAGASAQRGMDGKDMTNIGKIWKEDMGGGTKVAENASSNLTKNAQSHAQSDIARKDYNKDGRVDSVRYVNERTGEEKYVTSEDYEAAHKVAGRGAYKKQNVKDVLDIDEGMVVKEEASVSYDFAKEKDIKAKK